MKLNHKKVAANSFEQGTLQEWLRQKVEYNHYTKQDILKDHRILYISSTLEGKKGNYLQVHFILCML
jgi:hypothetical protein